LRVLVVDDCRDTVESLSQLLRLWGFDVRGARDGASALELSGIFRPGVVLLDLTLPDMDGLEVARRLRRDGRRPLLVCLSGWDGEEVRRRCLDAGCDLYLLKPANPARLRSLLDCLSGVSSGLAVPATEQA